MVVKQRRLLETLPERVDPAHTALLVVDMQNDYVSPGGHTHAHRGTVAAEQAILPPLVQLLDAARAAGVLVIFIQMTLDFPGGRYSSDAEYLRRLQRNGEQPMVVKGTWGHEVVAELKPQPGDLIVEKHRSSAFVGTDLDLVLRSSGIRSVVVTGVVTQGCVFATAQGAFMYDYYVTVAGDCVGSSNATMHETGMQMLRHYLFLDDSVVPAERIIDCWLATPATVGRGAVQHEV
jgi:nicotinamidase-related amidase